MTRENVHPSVSRWLFVGLILVFIQVAIGGITRLTDSGLSITEWAIIQGTIPPLSLEEWEEAFEMYKEAAGKQFMSLHADMTLGEFKVIFFWEYFHRLWARMMGIVFLVPFLVFWRRKMIPPWLMKRLGVVILLASTAAVFGWIMVASGLNDDRRTWVSAYKLVAHLIIATSLFGYLFWTWLLAKGQRIVSDSKAILGNLPVYAVLLVLVQIILGGLMAGMKAGLVHPHYPVFVNGQAFFSTLFDRNEIGTNSFIDYEGSAFVKAWVQILHRGFAILLLITIFYLYKRMWKIEKMRRSAVNVLGVVVVQYVLGIVTVIGSIGKIPVAWGVLHQGVALILWINLLFIYFISRKD